MGGDTIQPIKVITITITRTANISNSPGPHVSDTIPRVLTTAKEHKSDFLHLTDSKTEAQRGFELAQGQQVANKRPS
jgi:hypothetical protein